MSNEYNSSVAAMLRTLAEYVEMSEGNVKLRVGIMFRLKNRPLVKIPVMPVDKFSAALGDFVSGEIIRTVRNYQKATGKEDGEDLVAQFTQAQNFFRGLTK